MVLTIDIGNTDIVSILYDENKNKMSKERVSLVSVNFIADPSEYLSELVNRWQLENTNYIVSCVVYNMQAKIADILECLIHKKGMFINYSSYKEITSNLDNPHELGADLLAVSAALVHTNTPTVIVDMGSATKILLIDNMQLQGVSIMLGVQNNMEALSQKIVQLPNVDIKLNGKLLGVNTVDAIQSGLMYSTLYGIKAYTQAIEDKLNKKVVKVLTGGIANAFKDELNDFIFEADLVNLGLLEIYFKNKEFFL